jgi:Tol biopolymer transport system component
MSAETIGEGKVIATGNVYEPSWSANSKKIYYIKANSGSRDIVIYDITTGQETFLGKGTGEYAYPVPSPMLSKNP